MLDSKELAADVHNSVSSAQLASANDPTTFSQNASEFDFNEFFRIDSVSVKTSFTKPCIYLIYFSLIVEWNQLSALLLFWDYLVAGYVFIV